MIELGRSFGRRLIEGIASYAAARSGWEMRVIDGRDFGKGNLDGYDGFIIRVMNEQIAKALKATGKPVVDVYAGLPFGPFASVDCNDSAIGALAGISLGALTGYFGGLTDDLIMRLNDALTAFPSILLALVCIALLGFGKYNVILALGVAFIPSFARVSRTEFARHREMTYVKSARLMGASHVRIILRHILPNTGSVLLPALVIGFNNAVLAEAGMSYLGIGVKAPDVSLGYMLSESQSYMMTAPWYVLCTGLVIVLLLLGVSLIGEGLQREGRA